MALSRAIEQDNLTLALTTRGLIGQAIGLTMARFQISSDRAFRFLIRASFSANTKLRDIAEEVVRQANARYEGRLRND